MSWHRRLQQRLSITRNEALTLISLSLFLMLGTAGRLVCRHIQPFSDETYAEVDSIFAERSAAVLDGPDDLASTSRPRAADPDSAEASALNIGKNSASRRAIATKPARRATALHIDLNRASLEELEQLPRVGPRMAERIVAFRETYGAIRNVDELLDVPGIGPKTLEQLRPHVYVEADTAR